MRYKYLRFLLLVRSANNALDHKKPTTFDPIQEYLYHIVLKLIHDCESELNFDYLVSTYHVERYPYLVIINSMNLSINLTEYKDDHSSNNFDVSFEEHYMKIIISNFNREVHKRMEKNQILRTTKVAKHLKSILDNIEFTQAK